MEDKPLTHKLHIIVSLLDKIADNLLISKFNITFRVFLTIQIISELQNPTQNMIAECAGLSKGMVSKIIFKLVNDDFVKIQEIKADRRSNKIILTKKALKILKDATIFLENELLTSSFGSKDEYNKLDKYLTNLIFKLNNYERR